MQPDKERFLTSEQHATHTENVFSIPPVPGFGQPSVIQLEPQDTVLEDVLRVVKQSTHPVVLVVPDEPILFTKKQDFARLHTVASGNRVCFVFPSHHLWKLGRLAREQGFHATVQIPEAASYLSRLVGSKQQSEATGVPASEKDLQYAISAPVAPIDEQQERVAQKQESLQVTDYASVPHSAQQGRYDPVTPLPESFVAAPAKSTNKWRVAVVVILLALLILSVPVFSTIFAQSANSVLILPAHSTTAPPTPSIVGELFFSSSGQLDPNSSTGLNDIVTLNLSGIAPSQPGMAEYAWLETDNTQDGTLPILLGQLQEGAGNDHLTYQDKQHTNLLVTYSRFLVTEQPTTPAPSRPSLDTKTWHYQASIPNVPTPGDENGYSLLSHIRHLLAFDPTLHALGLQGGLDIWLYRNTGKVFEWSNAARDDWSGNNVGSLRREVDRVVEYLDGQVYAVRDLPPGTPWLVDPRAGRPGILDDTTAQAEQGPSSYITHVRVHLTGLINAPGHSAAQKLLAGQLDAVLAQMEAQLERTRHDAVQLAHMSDSQLQQPKALSLLDDMQTTATNAYIGQTGAGTGQVQDGEAFIHASMQRFASMTITTVQN